MKIRFERTIRCIFLLRIHWCVVELKMISNYFKFYRITKFVIFFVGNFVEPFCALNLKTLPSKDVREYYFWSQACVQNTPRERRNTCDSMENLKIGLPKNFKTSISLKRGTDLNYLKHIPKHNGQKHCKIVYTSWILSGWPWE